MITNGLYVRTIIFKKIDLEFTFYKLIFDWLKMNEYLLSNYFWLKWYFSKQFTKYNYN